MNPFIELLHNIWESIKKFFVAILNWGKNIVSWFKNPKRIETLKNNADTIAVAIKENLKNGDYRTVNCLFNKQTNKIEDLDTEAGGIESSDIDNDTQNAFGNKPMVILQ